jgi:uncharacterized protein YndB with AHSA1/START domain
MNEPAHQPQAGTADTAGRVSLVVRRVIRATPARLFDSWTEPARLMQWWGPEGVSCPEAEVDLRVGGRYRIANLFADGSLVWISGEFEIITPPRLLVYTWRLGSSAHAGERVTVRFEARDAATEVIVLHERIADATKRDGHALGWNGCLTHLQRHLEGAAA